jgi:LuxR family maltose regulon positive regulatory protein
VSPRDTAELQLVCAVAHLRRGDVQAGCRAFMVALRLCDQGLLRPFAHVPSEDLRELCRLTATDSARLAPALAHETGSAPVSLLALTSAEEEVLTALAAGATTTRIAAHRGVSVNTVRTQVKSLYRKLGASDRSAALARAARLHLVAHR